jgi:sugar O-acyltransferase (sialic acid O-acetyltransferase NeuD family)
MQNQLVILGGVGDGLVVAETIRQASASGSSISALGFLSDTIPKGDRLADLPVLGRFEDWRLLGSDVVFIPAIQKAQDMVARVKRLEGLGIEDARWATVIHPKAEIASDAKIGVGTFIASFVTIQPGAKLGRFSSVRAGAMLGHHCAIADHAYVGPNATMCGHSALLDAAHLGPGAVLLDSKFMGRYSVAGIGAAVTKDVPEYTVVFGNPARRVGWIKRV